jgi:pimeloyl-ACP methyl ester carboxylesterase
LELPLRVFSILSNFVAQAILWICAIAGAGVLPASSALAQPPRDCFRPDVSRIELPIYSDRPGSATFIYRWQRKLKNPDSATPIIVYVPGGPGGTSMDFSPENPFFDFIAITFGLPKSYDIILTDPRGRGCNRDKANPLPDDAFQSAYLADDILAMIRHLHLQNYILMGHSYGSMLATEIAARAGRGEAAIPRAVVISGIVGKAFAPFEQENAFELEWSLVRAKLPADIAAQFPRTLAEIRFSPSAPFGASGEAWFVYIKSQLTQGEVWIGGKRLLPSLQEQLTGAFSGDTDKRNKLLEAVKASLANSSDLGNSPIFLQIGCRELFSKQDEDCRNRGIKADRPFDSASWQVPAPIYYVQGEHDPNTPPSGARYHYLHQQSPSRTLISVPSAGHGVMGALMECKDVFWQSILNGGVDLQQSLNTCTVKPKVITPNDDRL